VSLVTLFPELVAVERLQFDHSAISMLYKISSKMTKLQIFCLALSACIIQTHYTDCSLKKAGKIPWLNGGRRPQRAYDSVMIGKKKMVMQHTSHFPSDLNLSCENYKIHSRLDIEIFDVTSAQMVSLPVRPCN
jgi:hypothetical protein